MKNNSHLHRFSRRTLRSCAFASVLGLIATSASAQSSGSGSSSSSSTSTQDNSATTSGPASTVGAGQEINNDTSGSSRTDRSTLPATGNESAYPSRTSGASGLERSDRRFIEKAAECDQREMQALQLGVSRASDPQIRNLSQQLTQEHQQMHTELMALAQRKGVMLEDHTQQQDRHIRKLSNESGKDFDKEYLEQLKEEHEDAVKLFEKAATDSKDSDIRAFAGKHLPSLRDHLNKVKDQHRMLKQQ